MKYLYLALIDHDHRWEAAGTAEAISLLREMDMHERFACSDAKIFVSSDTPTFPLPHGGLVIGHLFLRSGVRVRDCSQFPLPRLDSREQVRKHVLENCWGEYLLIQPGPEGKLGLVATRSPSASGDLACVYELQRGSGIITSDISLAMRLGLYRSRIDWGYIEERLAYHNLKAGRTGLLNVRELLPGSALHLNERAVSIEQVWSPWDFVATGSRYRELDEAASNLRLAAEQVVRAWADADESILLEVSGGLDSSIVGACLRGTNARVACCTVATPVPGADERQYASLIAEILDVKLCVQQLRIEDARVDFSLPPQYITPRMGPLQQVIDDVMQIEGDRHDVASYVSGGGGDTVFAYLRTAAPAADAFRERGLSAAAASVRDLSELHQCTLWKAARLTIWKLLRAPPPPYSTDRSFLAKLHVARPTEIHPWCVAPAGALPGDRERIYDLAVTQVYRDAIPRATKRQLRMPLLSQPVMEACLKVPCWMWISGGRNRSVARAAFADLLPPEILTRRSKGTFMSYLGAVYQKNKQQIGTFLQTGHLQAKGLLDTDALRRFMDRDLPSRDRTFIRLLDLCMVENWIRHQS